MASQLEVGVARRIRTVFRGAGSEPTGDTILLQLAERPYRIDTDRVCDTDGSAAVHYQHAHQSCAYRPITRFVYGNKSLCRNHSHGRFSPIAGSDAPPVQFRYTVPTD